MTDSNLISHTRKGCFDRYREQSALNPDLFPESLTVLRHADVVRILEDHESYSNAVSQHLSVPNGMDPPEHTPFRELIEPYFTAGRMNAFAPDCLNIAREIIRACAEESEVEVMQKMAAPYVLKVQCVWLGWPESMHNELWQWMEATRVAVKTRDRSALADQADHFTQMVQSQLDLRREAGVNAPEDITTELLKAQVNGRPLTDTEIISILRNWTAGEVGTLSASVGIIMNFCAENPALQQQLREDHRHWEEAIDEILRLHAPLLSNRRVTRCPVNHGGKTLPADTRLIIPWESANRDPEAFPNPDTFQWGRDPDKNLLWGKGIHVCPGAPLAKLQLKIFMRELLSQIPDIRPGKSQTPAAFPGTGFEELFLKFG
ncbi:cytochrome P450 [Kiritimatiellaeota bacterium B1221]|nr:cytochrome P450 [Kiritimatiellaeota bacterium B1221]